MTELNYNQILKNQDTISKLTLDEVRKLKHELQKREYELKTNPPTYHMLNDPDNIKISTRNIIDDTLMSRIEYVVSVNKEAVQDHKALWKLYIIDNYGVKEENYNDYIHREIFNWIFEKMIDCCDI